jgi:hypothetical protein
MTRPASAIAVEAPAARGQIKRLCHGMAKPKGRVSTEFGAPAISASSGVLRRKSPAVLEISHLMGPDQRDHA